MSSVVALVVDDEPSNRSLMQYALRSRGHTVVAAEGYDDALDLFRSTPTIEVLITDVRLKVGNGIELAATLHASRPDLKILLTSGCDPDRIRALLEGVEFQHIFLPKPFTAGQFFGAVWDVLCFRDAANALRDHHMP